MKKISARIGSYEKDGQTKGRFTQIGVIGQTQDGKEYVLIDPTVDLGGVLALQNVQAWKEGKEPSERIIASVFDESASQGQQGGYGQNNGYQAPQQNYQQPQQQAPQNYQQPPRQQHQQSNSAPNRSAPVQGMDSFDDD